MEKLARHGTQTHHTNQTTLLKTHQITLTSVWMQPVTTAEILIMNQGVHGVIQLIQTFDMSTVMSPYVVREWFTHVKLIYK